jgi:HD-GYP domain-containing protein (c-di-GMP phosphodiesterase class II)
VSAPRLAELLGSLSLACDLANGFPSEKVLRTVVLALELGRRMSLPADELRRVYWVSVLRYLGCTGFAHEEAHEFGAGDDNNTRNVMSFVDAADPLDAVVRVARGIGKEGGALERARAVARLLNGKSAVMRHARAQCEAAIRLATIVGFGTDVQSSLSQICERYDGLGAPAGLAGSELTLPIRLSHLSDVTEIAHHRGGRAAALAMVKKRRGKQFDPAIADVLLESAPELFERLESDDVWQAFLDLEPSPRAVASEAQVDDVATAFAHFVDQKSTYTLGHSTGVARLAERASRALGLDDAAVLAVRRAALLHDLGRVSVPTGTWDKPGPLSMPEWERVRLHAYYTERVLSASPLLRSLAVIAAAAHERSDGSGYHRGVRKSALDKSARVLAVADTYHALGELRPHRAPLAPEQARQVLLDGIEQGRFDRDSVNAVLEAAGTPGPKQSVTAPAGLTERELEVLRLLARGRSNKEIASALAIATRTAQHHVENIYGKIGVSSRAAAALFATQHDLLDT